MATSAPHNWAVISREFAFRRASVKGVATDTTQIIASFPGPYAYSVPLLDLYFERHLAAGRGSEQRWFALGLLLFSSSKSRLTHEPA